MWTKKAPGSNYAAQVADVAGHWQHQFGQRCVLAGDFNASVQGPSRQPHLANIARLSELGMVSAYHHHRGVEHGDEADMTLRWIGPGGTVCGYHCDFVMVSQDLAARIETVEMGSMEEWVESGRSDHCPVTVTFG